MKTKATHLLQAITTSKWMQWRTSSSVCSGTSSSRSNSITPWFRTPLALMTAGNQCLKPTKPHLCFFLIFAYLLNSKEHLIIQEWNKQGKNNCFWRKPGDYKRTLTRSSDLSLYIREKDWYSFSGRRYLWKIGWNHKQIKIKKFNQMELHLTY